LDFRANRSGRERATMNDEVSSIREDRNVERYLGVGRPAAFDSDPFHKEAPRYSTHIRGWRRPSYILLERPTINGRYAAMHENQQCAIRFVSEGRACAFDTCVLDWDTRSFNAYCRVAWPQSLKTASFRKFERIGLTQPCTIAAADIVAEGIIHDVSLGGCALSTKIELEKGSTCRLSFPLPEGIFIDGVACVVRRVAQIGDDAFSIGCEFKPGQPIVSVDIAYFTMASLDRSGLLQSQSERTLIISENDALRDLLAPVLEAGQFEVLQAASVVDGIVRLRLSTPCAIIIDGNVKELGVAQFVRMLRRTRGCENVSLFVLCASPEVAAEATAAGANGCFSKETAGEKIAAAMKQE
jgi:CheY-like chemotaxis protein